MDLLEGLATTRALGYGGALTMWHLQAESALREFSMGHRADLSAAGVYPLRVQSVA